MLRVSSILYLENIWTRPIEIKQNQIDSESVCNSSISDTLSIVQEESVLEISSEPQEIAEPMVTANELDQHDSQLVTIEQVLKDDLHPLDIAMTVQEENTSSNNSVTDGSNHSLLDSRSETPLTNHEEIAAISFEEKTIKNLEISTSTNSSSTSSSNNNKFSPKKILHRAKSSITEDSTVIRKSLGRRTSMFLDKINSLHHSPSSHPINTKSNSLPALLNQPLNPLKNLRRQSSKLTDKGKSFTKKLKRAMTISLPQQQQIIS